MHIYYIYIYLIIVELYVWKNGINKNQKIYLNRFLTDLFFLLENI